MCKHGSHAASAYCHFLHYLYFQILYCAEKAHLLNYMRAQHLSFIGRNSASIQYISVKLSKLKAK